MWPDKPMKYIKLPEDADGKHFGLFVDDKLVSVISLFINKHEAQFRKFATLETEQGKGYGTKLLTYVISNVSKNFNITRLWCNARVEKTDFYSHFGLQPTEKKFTKGGIDYVIMERVK